VPDATVECRNAANYGVSIGAQNIIYGLNAGTNTFTLNFVTSGGTTSTFENRRLTVQGVA
jgi:hypothetical protein